MASSYDIIQRTDDWFAARCGKATASKIADIIAKTKSGYSASRTNYAAQLVCERLTGTPTEGFTNAAMQWGVDHEDEACNAYAFHYDAPLATIGFIDHPSIEMSGASPDRLVGDKGLAEIKCPNSATHIDTLLTGKVPEKYVTQMLWQMACTGREWCDFVSYDPRLPEEMRLFVHRVERNDLRVKDLEDEVSAFLNEVAETVESLRNKFMPMPAESANLIKLVRAG